MRYSRAASDPIFAEMEKRLHTDHEDLLIGLLRFPDGITAFSRSTADTDEGPRDLVSASADVRVDDLTRPVLLRECTRREDPMAALQTLRASGRSMIRYSIPRFEPLRAELEAFVGAIAAGRRSGERSEGWPPGAGAGADRGGRTTSDRSRDGRGVPDTRVTVRRSGRHGGRHRVGEG